MLLFPRPIFSADFHSIVPEKHRKAVHPYAKEGLVVAGTRTEADGAGVEVKPVGQEEEEVIWRLATAGGDNTIRVSRCRPLRRGRAAGQVAVRRIERGLS